MTRKSLKKIVNQIYILYYFAFKAVYVADTLGISTESAICPSPWIPTFGERFMIRRMFMFFAVQPQCSFSSSRKLCRKTIPPNVGIRGEMADSVHNVTQLWQKLDSVCCSFDIAYLVNGSFDIPYLVNFEDVLRERRNWFADRAPRVRPPRHRRPERLHLRQPRGRQLSRRGGWGRRELKHLNHLFSSPLQYSQFDWTRSILCSETNWVCTKQGMWITGMHFTEHFSNAAFIILDQIPSSVHIQLVSLPKILSVQSNRHAFHGAFF